MISAASAVNFKGAFWYCAYQGGLNADLFVALPKKMMWRRLTPVHLVVAGRPAHKTALVKHYVASANGLLTLRVLSGYALELNADGLAWSHMKRTGVARTSLRKGEKRSDKTETLLAAIKRMPRLVRSFFKAPHVPILPTEE
ncbi:MAG: transposase [Methylocella sp.]